MARQHTTNYGKPISEILNDYRKQGFENDQLEEIRQGLVHGVFVKQYADKDYFAVQMRQLRFGLEHEIDISLYNDKQYDWFQMEEIRLGLEAGLDASIYAKPEFSYEVMREIRKALADDIHLEKYAAVGAEMLHELHLAILDKQNIMPYIKAGYIPEQLTEIRHAMKQGCDISPYLNIGYRGAAIREMVEGLEAGLDIRIYSKLEYSWQQMREIRLGLEERVDVSIYAKELYSWQQMREIRLGLKEKLDVTKYKGMVHSAADMRKIRMELQEEREQYESLLNAAGEEEVSSTFQKYCAKLPPDAIRFYVEPDRLRAYAFVGASAPKLTKERLLEELAEKKIVKGINRKLLNDLMDGKLNDQVLVLARGKLPTKGKDGYYESFIKDYEKKGLEQMDDGSYDYQDAYLFEKVHAGQKLMVYHQAEAGVDGYTIDGEVLRAPEGKEKNRIKGRGFRLLEDNQTYLAEESGCVSLRGDNLVISRLLELDEATNVLGDIDFSGCVHIKGDAGGNVKIKATGDIVVEGFLGNAVLESESSILLKKGANGNGEAKLKAAETVMGRFFENTEIEAKRIQSNSFYRCELHAEEVLVASGINGSITGGSAYAGFSMEAGNVGNASGVATEILLGYDKEKVQNDYSEQLKETESQLLILNNAYEKCIKVYPAEQRSTMPVFLKIEDAIYTKKKDKDAILRLIEQQEQERRKALQAYIKVYGNLYEGTTMIINNVVYHATESSGVMIRNISGRITIQHTRRS